MTYPLRNKHVQFGLKAVEPLVNMISNSLNFSPCYVIASYFLSCFVQQDVNTLLL